MSGLLRIAREVIPSSIKLALRSVCCHAAARSFLDVVGRSRRTVGKYEWWCVVCCGGGGGGGRACPEPHQCCPVLFSCALASGCILGISGVFVDDHDAVLEESSS